MTGIVAVRIEGTQKLNNRLKQIITPNKKEQALDRSAFLIENDAKRLVRVDTGALRSSINVIRIPGGRAIGSSKSYAAAQEFGRPDLSGYGYTPYLRPAARMNMNKINLIFKELLER